MHVPPEFERVPAAPALTPLDLTFASDEMLCFILAETESQVLKLQSSTIALPPGPSYDTSLRELDLWREFRVAVDTEIAQRAALGNPQET